MYVCWQSVMGDLERLLTHFHVPIYTCRWRHPACRKTFILIALNCPSEQRVLQHKWSLQKEEGELVCYSEALAPGSCRLRYKSCFIIYWM